MASSLKEALLDQLASLQERGLAPSEVPQEDDTPLVVVESAPRGRMMRRRSGSDFGESDELFDGNSFDRDRRRTARRGEGRGEEGVRGAPGADRRRPPMRGGRGRRPDEMEIAPIMSPSFGGNGAPRGPRPAGPGMGPRPPMRPGMGAPRGPMGPGGPNRGGPPSRTAMLQQRADQRRQEEQDLIEMRQLLAEISGGEYDEDAMEKFSRGLAEETGALPPPRVVVAAIKESRSADPKVLGNAVRLYYRRARSPRPAQPGQPPVQQRPAAPAPEPEPEPQTEAAAEAEPASV